MNCKKSIYLIAFFLAVITMTGLFSSTANAFTFTTGTWNGETIEYIEGKLLIEKSDTCTETELDNLLSQYDFELCSKLIFDNWVFAETKDPKIKVLETIAKLSAEPEIQVALPNGKVVAAWAPNDPKYTDGSQWYLNNYGQDSGTAGMDIHIVDGWGFSRGNGSFFSNYQTKIGIVDTGLPYDNNDNFMHSDLNSSDIEVGNSHVPAESNMYDNSGHGTAILGLLAANSNNSVGITGIAPDARYYISKGLDYTGTGTYETVYPAFYEVIEENPDIVLLPFTMDVMSVGFWNNVLVENDDILFIAPTGNDNSHGKFPAMAAIFLDNVLAVGSTDRDNNRTSFSNFSSPLYSNWNFIMAPGSDIYSTSPPNSYTTSLLEGTSFSAAMVTGIATIIHNVDPTLTPSQIISSLENTADDIGSAGWDDLTGFGSVNAAAAIEYISPSINGYTPTGHTTWEYSILLDGDIIVSSGNTLEINEGVHVVSRDPNGGSSRPMIDVTGKLIAEGSASDPIVFRRAASHGLDGPSIRFNSGVDVDSKIQYCNFIGHQYSLSNDNNIIWILPTSTSITLNHSISNNKFIDYEGLAINASLTNVHIEDNIFDGPGKAIKYYMPLPSVLIEGNKVYDGSSTDGTASSIKISSGSVVIRHNYLDFSETTNKPIGIELYNAGGTFCWRNTISDAWNGIKLTNSDATLTANKMIRSASAGLSIHNSVPDMCVSGEAKNYLENNYFGSVGTQIYIDDNVYPYMANGFNNIFPGSGDAITTINPPTTATDLSNNYWGPAYPNPPLIFSPYSGFIDITPYNTGINVPFSGYLTSSIIDNDFEAALYHFKEQEYEEAADKFIEILLNSSDLHHKHGSINRLVDCWKALGSIDKTSILTLEDISGQLENQTLVNKIEDRIAFINVQLGNYSEAISHYESIIQDPASSSFAKLYAEIDAKTVYIVASDSNQDSYPSKLQTLGVPLMSSIQDLCPESRLDYEKDIRDLKAKIEKLIREANDYKNNVSENILPTEYAITSAYPNPFNPSITIAYSLPEKADVTMKVFDILGKEVVTLLNASKSAGNHNITWNAMEDGMNTASGVYFIHFQTPESTITKKVVLVK